MIVSLEKAKFYGPKQRSTGVRHGQKDYDAVVTNRGMQEDEGMK
jgi:hypothetical protein